MVDLAKWWRYSKKDGEKSRWPGRPDLYHQRQWILIDVWLLVDPPHAAVQPLSRLAACRRVVERLPHEHIPLSASRPPTPSGIERRRVSLVRQLMNDYRQLIMNDPEEMARDRKKSGYRGYSRKRQSETVIFQISREVEREYLCGIHGPDPGPN